MRLCRNKSLSVHSNTGKGFIGEQTVAIVRGLVNCNLELDNFNARFDLSIDSEHGRIQVKSRWSYFGDWNIHIGMIHNFDTLFVLCIHENGKDIERVYVIPEKELYGILGIGICKDYSKWEKFRVNEKQYNDAYHHVLSNLKNCPVLKEDQEK